MVHPLLVTVIGRGVWVAVGAGIGYLVASGKEDKAGAAAPLMSQVEAGHVAFIVKDYEVAKVLEPQADIAQDELPGIINVRFTGHLPQNVAWEVQQLLSKGKIKLGAIESMIDQKVRSQLVEALDAKQISQAQKIVADYCGYAPAEPAFRNEQFVKQICFWVWLIDFAKKRHFTRGEMEDLGITGS